MQRAVCFVLYAPNGMYPYPVHTPFECITNRLPWTKGGLRLLAAVRQAIPKRLQTDTAVANKRATNCITQFVCYDL